METRTHNNLNGYLLIFIFKLSRGLLYIYEAGWLFWFLTYAGPKIMAIYLLGKYMLHRYLTCTAFLALLDRTLPDQ